MQLQEFRSVSVFEMCDKKNVGVATMLWARQAGVRIPVETKMFLLSEKSRPVLGLTQPPIQWAPGFFLGDKAARE